LRRLKALVFGLLLIGSIVATAGIAGNGAPSGAHYNLNIIGVKDKTADMDYTSGHTIFVKLWGNSTINLCQSGTVGDCAEPGFYVIDRNGTDQDGATFALPNPDPTNSGTTSYSVFVRGLGQPGKYADMKTCAIDPTPEPTDPSPVECSLAVLTIAHAKGQSPKFVNASKQLLYIYADLDGDGDVDRAPLFDTSLEDFFWDYDNHGQRLAQLRFYPCPTTVPDPEDWEDPVVSSCIEAGATPT
jgi:hypothetical protein